MKTLRIISAIIVFAAAIRTQAASVYWNNPGQGLWSDPSNWLSNAIPGVTDDARINNGGTNVIDSSQTIVTGDIQVADTNLTTGTLIMTGGNLTTGTTDLRVGGNSATGGGTGFFQLSGGTVVMNAGNLNVGFGTNAIGTITMSGGSLQMNAAGVIFAVANRGVGTVTQSGGSLYLHSATGSTQLGRNVAAGTGFGTYNLSGGTLATARLQFGNAVGTAGISTNILNVSGTGTLVVGSISNINTSASNIFNFTGGTLTCMTNAFISITNNGGTLSPATIDFASTNGTNLASLPINPIGTNIFAGARYVQGSTGVLAIDIAGAGANDLLNITPGPTAFGATIAGSISVRLLNGYNPPLGSTFDIVNADLVTCTATVTGNLDSGFSTSIVAGGNGQLLRLIVTNQPVVAPRIGAAILGNGSCQLNFTNTPNHTFSVIGSTNVAATGWSVLGSATEISTGQYQFTDSQTSGKAQRFYQVRWP